MRSLNWPSAKGMCAPSATSGRAQMLCSPELAVSVASRVVRSMTQLQKAQNSALCMHRNWMNRLPCLCLICIPIPPFQSTASMSTLQAVMLDV